MVKGDKILRWVAAAHVREVRKSLKWSQEKLAHEAGLHRTYIGQVERGGTNISVDNLELLANALSTPAYKLLIPKDAPKAGASNAD